MSAHAEAFGQALPSVRTEVPGPASCALAQRLSLVESRNITCIEPVPPIFWEAARGANVRDVDGNVYIDLTAGFGVATAGHAPPRVVSAIAEQAALLAHGLGDVHPSPTKVRLLEELAARAPVGLEVVILGSAGAEAVEAALKTAALRTGRVGIIAFEGSYHGLTYGALAVTHRTEFRAPFADQLFPGVRFAPFPTRPADLAPSLATLDALLHDSETPIGAIIVEPIQGRGGLRFPAQGFLAALRERADGNRIVLIFDECYTGMGRTGRWFACEHAGVTPDILVVGKGLTGTLPLSAAIGSADVMAAWPPSTGEAIHTSTFLGNPIACAAALAQIATIEETGLLERAEEVGWGIADRTSLWARGLKPVRETRGIGALQAVEFNEPGMGARISERALRRGIIVLPEGPSAEVLALTPPVTITDQQLHAAIDILHDTVAEL